MICIFVALKSTHMNSHFVTSLLAFFLTSLSFAQSVLTIHGDKPGAPISKAMYGLFFEEINHAGDGGLYGTGSQPFL